MLINSRLVPFFGWISSLANVRDGTTFRRSINILITLFVAQCIFLLGCLIVSPNGRQLLLQQSPASSFPSFRPPCPDVPPGLVGFIPVSYSSPTHEELERLHPELELGGRWQPENCTAVDRVALVVPFRDRDAHLRTFLQHIHPFLQKQQLDYCLFVVEQSSSSAFNRGMLMNIGYVEALKMNPTWDCFIFHDVDLLPENDHNIYSCPVMPRHMSVAVDTMAHRLMYPELFGGIEAFSTEHFRLVNGFSNQFFGWGGEDDDIYARLIHAGLNLTRYPTKVARYRMLNHERSNPNPRRQSLLLSAERRFDSDGLSSLGGYRVKVELRKLYTNIYADINQKYVMNRPADRATGIR
jgi:hypothetical protein